ncbi:AAA-domain-containing protein [Xylariaceae sp. FL0255]|nr:AAA-domain-containing protein [Xylariaceae sp. FL0255]
MKDEFKTRIQPTDVEGKKNPTHKNAAKIFLHPSTFTPTRFVTGGICVVEVRGNKYEAVAWPSDGKINSNIVGISRVFQSVAEIELGETVHVTPGDPMRNAETVVMRQIASDFPPLPSAGAVRAAWQTFLEHKLETAGYILPGTPYEEVLLKGQTRSFVLDSVNGSVNRVAKYDPETTVIEITDEAVDGVKVNGIESEIRLELLPNMAEQVKKINFFLDGYGLELTNFERPPYTCGLIIDGSHGTGKTLLLKHIAALRWGRVLSLKKDDKPSTLRDIFETAVDSRDPTIIMIDNLMTFIRKENPNRTSFITFLEKGLDMLAKKAEEDNIRPGVLVIATCLEYYDDIPYDLKQRGLFCKHVHLTCPDAAGRSEILLSWKDTFPSQTFDSYLPNLVERTHAFTGGDLDTLFDLALDARRERVGKNSVDAPLEWQDFKKVLKDVRPSAIREIDLKPPTVHWSDIGGYEDVKLALQTALKARTDSTKNLWVPPKGILLYGPPGCSKTMTAQAIATEIGYNFLAVKGGELLNMYVGETERSIRNIFKRAAEASPSIIFFDEIDSLAASRWGEGGSSGGSGGVQAVTTLLTEMDGFEQRGEVFVLAATNRPDRLDPALLRHGRFDKAVYVPLPDLDARRAIVTRMAEKLRFEEVDIEELARLTDGYSGADICGICEGAFEPKREGENGGGGEGQVVAMEVLKKAIRNAPKTVNALTLSYFTNWRK